MARADGSRASTRGWEVLSAEPLVLQTPVELLAGQRITDKSALFVRNCQDLPTALTLDPVPLAGWEIELAGLIEPHVWSSPPRRCLGMEQIECEMVLQCSGNGRSEYAGIPGTPWGLGGVGNVRFGGVPLSAILARYDVEVDARVRYVTAEGQHLPAGVERPDFEHSLPVADVLDRSSSPSPSTASQSRRCMAVLSAWSLPASSARCR